MVIESKKFPVGVGLFENTIKTVRKKLSSISDRHDDGNEGLG